MNFLSNSQDFPEALRSQGCWGRTAYLEYFSAVSSSRVPELWNISFRIAETRDVFPQPDGPFSETNMKFYFYSYSLLALCRCKFFSSYLNSI